MIPSPSHPSTAAPFAAPADLTLRAIVGVQSAVVVGLARVARAGDRGQSTAEYALVMLGAAAVALMLVTWAGSTNKITRLLDKVLDSVISKFS